MKKPLFACVVILFMATACQRAKVSSSGGHITTADSVSSLERITQSIANGDAKTLASLTHYPLMRRYPLKNIENAQQMMAYFDIMFDDSIRNKLRHATINDWYEVGWRGCQFGNGMLWTTPDTLYAINYMSAKESRLLEELRTKEMNTLHTSMQSDGWTPYKCLQSISGDTVIRIDQHDDLYRMALYHAKNLHDTPNVCLTGDRDIQGRLASVTSRLRTSNRHTYLKTTTIR